MPDDPQRVTLSDKALVRRLLAGEEAAFRQFFDGHFSRLYRFALRRTEGDHDAAEEIAQKTLITAMRKLHTFRGEATLFTWLVRDLPPRSVRLAGGARTALGADAL